MEGNPRPTESSSDVKFEIGHVLFIDIEPDLVEQLTDSARRGWRLVTKRKRLLR